MCSFEKIDNLTWIYVGEWLDRFQAIRLADDLYAEHHDIIIETFSDRDRDDHHNGWQVTLEFKDEINEAMFIMRHV